MPFEWNNTIVVKKEELIPQFFPSYDALKQKLHNYKNKPYGPKRAWVGGNGRELLIKFDSLDMQIREALGDPRKPKHWLEEFYKIDSGAVDFFTTYRFPDKSVLRTEHQEQYITNASVIQAVFALKEARELERRSKNGSLLGIMKTLCDDAKSFNPYLKAKHGVEHNLPSNERRFKEALIKFEKNSYASLISGKFKNQNTRKVFDHTLELLNNMFYKESKPTATEVQRRYDAFLSGYVIVANRKTGEIYNPKDFKKLSVATVKKYLNQDFQAIGVQIARASGRMKIKTMLPHAHLISSDYAGSLLSIDDRQPPFKCVELDGERVWFYMALDEGSDAFTCWVHGGDKKGIIIEFYRQLVRNYAEWGLQLPMELECESNLNSSFKDTFLKEGAMFRNVRIEANNPQGKIIENRFNVLRNYIEKEEEGWLARPFARKEDLQAGPAKAPKRYYNDVVDLALRAIDKWNNELHPNQEKHPGLSRWKVFMTKQHPDIKPTNYMAFLPYIGRKTQTSCSRGQIQLNNEYFFLGENGKISTGPELIRMMKQVEGRELDIYWLDGNDGKIIKALVYLRNQSQFICEAVPVPKFKRARFEQTEQCRINQVLFERYSETIQGYANRQKALLEQVTIIDNTPPKEKDFVMPGLNRRQQPETQERTTAIMPDKTEFETENFTYTSKLQETGMDWY